MTKRSLLLFLTTIGLIATSLLVVYSIRTQRQEIRKKAAEEFKSLYFIAADGSYEVIMSYKFEYPKFIWKFDKLTCANDKALVQRRFLHIGKTVAEVVREGWIDQSFFQWSPGDPLPSGEVNIPLDKGCFFQFDVTMTIKPRFGQTSEETNGIDKGDSGTISGCALAPTVPPTPTPTTVIPPTATPAQPRSTSTPTNVPTATVTLRLSPTSTIRPSVTPTPSAGPLPTASVTPQNSPTPQPTATNQPAPTSTNAPAPTTGITVTQALAKSEPTPTEVQLPSAGIKIPTLSGIVAGFLLISIGLAFVF